MTSTFSILLSLLRHYVCGAPIDEKGLSALSRKQWQEIFDCACRNHIIGLTFDVLSRHKETITIPKQIYIMWASEALKKQERYEHVAAVEKKLRTLFEENNIPCLTLKGLTTSYYYPQPNLREFSDLDIYCFDQHQQADNLVAKAFNVPINNNYHHHTKYSIQGVTIESHYDILNRHHPHSNARFDDILKQTITTTTGQYLFFLRHAALHYSAAEMHLRFLVDNYYLYLHNIPNIDWAMVWHTLDDFGMQRFASSLFDTTKDLFGVPMPISFDVPQDKKSRIMEVIEQHTTTTKNVPAGGLKNYFRNARLRKECFNDSSMSMFIHKISAHIHRPR